MLYELLHDAVQQRLVADVPVGTFLSGGVDSSAIASYAADYQISIGVSKKSEKNIGLIRS